MKTQQQINTSAIISLWHEAHNPTYIAMKLGIYDETGEPDIELVEAVIDDPTNYVVATTRGPQ